MAIPTSPGSLRSPRKRALEIGTNPAGFSEPMAFDTQAGVPAAMSGGTYGAQPAYVGGGTGPINTSTPFANLKSK